MEKNCVLRLYDDERETVAFVIVETFCEMIIVYGKWRFDFIRRLYSQN